MAEASDTFGILYQNLLDAGCDEETIKKCISLVKEGRKVELLRLLTGHKSKLLSRVRKEQKKIDCLDFLTSELKKKNYLRRNYHEHEI